MAEIAIRGVRKILRQDRGRARRRPRPSRDGEFVVILGPSGCGKSTLLRMIAGLEAITAGEIAIDGKVVNKLEPRERGCAMVFQNYALYPHMTRRREHRLRPEGRRRAEGRAPAAHRQGRRRRSASTEFLDRKPAAALRRPAPARRHGPRHDPRAEGLPLRRAAVQPRRQAARPDAGRDPPAAPAARRHHASSSPTTRSRR